MKGAVSHRNQWWRKFSPGFLALLLVLSLLWWYAATSTKDLLARSTVFPNSGLQSRWPLVLVLGWVSEHEILYSVMRNNNIFDDFCQIHVPPMDNDRAVIGC